MMCAEVEAQVQPLHPKAPLLRRMLDSAGLTVCSQCAAILGF